MSAYGRDSMGGNGDWRLAEVRNTYMYTCACMYMYRKVLLYSNHITFIEQSLVWSKLQLPVVYCLRALQRWLSPLLLCV